MARPTPRRAAKPSPRPKKGIRRGVEGSKKAQDQHARGNAAAQNESDVPVADMSGVAQGNIEASAIKSVNTSQASARRTRGQLRSDQDSSGAPRRVEKDTQHPVPTRRNRHRAQTPDVARDHVNDAELAPHEIAALQNATVDPSDQMNASETGKTRRGKATQHLRGDISENNSRDNGDRRSDDAEDGVQAGQNQENAPNGEKEEQQPPKKTKGRRRAPTPEGAEDYEIDEDVMLGELTHRSRLGKMGRLSKTERSMRNVDWDQVKRQRKQEEEEQLEEAYRKVEAAERGEEEEPEQEEQHQDEEQQEPERMEDQPQEQPRRRRKRRRQEQEGQEDQEQTTDRPEELQPENRRKRRRRKPAEQDREAEEQPQNIQGGIILTVNEQGQIIADPSSLQEGARQDAEMRAQAETPPQEEPPQAEEEITRHFNTHTHIFKNRRDPVEKLPLVHKPKSWNEEATEEFYEALRMFGTDFFIISKMFAGKTRHQIKLKFSREERENPERINAALIHERKPMSLEKYASATGKDVDSFIKDPQEFYGKLQAEESQRREAIYQERMQAKEAAKEKKEAAIRKQEEAKQRKEERKRIRKEKKRKKEEQKNKRRKRGKVMEEPTAKVQGEAHGAGAEGEAEDVAMPVDEHVDGGEVDVLDTVEGAGDDGDQGDDAAEVAEWADPGYNDDVHGDDDG